MLSIQAAEFSFLTLSVPRDFFTEKSEPCPKKFEKDCSKLQEVLDLQ